MELVKYFIYPNTYRDSVALMQINKIITSSKGITEAFVGMGTDYNKEILERQNLLSPPLKEVTPYDLIMVIKGEKEEDIDGAQASAIAFLSNRESTDAEEYLPVSQEAALKVLPEANLVLISTPGDYAAWEGEKALNYNMNVMMFSDNVLLKDEIRLKEKARRKGILFMGPDCGTAIISGVPLGFANVIPRGNIGIVAASGTGLQEVSSLIATLGGGISQGIGTGGRDLSLEVGAVTMLMGMEALAEDRETEVLVLLSKPPAKNIMSKVLSLAKKIPLPVVINFIGFTRDSYREDNLYFEPTFKHTALRALSLAYDKDYEGLKEQLPKPLLPAFRKRRSDKVYLRGLYSGGSLCSEAIVLLNNYLGEIYSNVHISGCTLPLSPPYESIKHTILDLGDDYFTRGRPHPMIDFSLRCKLLWEEAQQLEVGVILLDVVLGYGAAPEPAEELKDVLSTISTLPSPPYVIISLCGTEEDPQKFSIQKEKLEDMGALVCNSNVDAVELAAQIVLTLREN